jgi:hypothetical protein
MAAARVAAVVLSFLVSTILAAQQPAQGHLAIQVNDASGAYVPMAGIEAESLAGRTKILIKAGSQGRAWLALPVGSYRLSVAYFGFETSTSRVEIAEGRNSVIEVTLQAARTTCDPCGTIEATELNIAVEHLPLNAFIPLHSLESPVTIRTAHNSGPERATKVQLERLTAAHDLRQWTFTHEVVIDEKSIPHSHPVLTLHTRHLKQDDELLSTYIHEQLHWSLTRHPLETQAAEQDLMKLYPNVPVAYPEGAQDAESTYLHLLVCWLEQQADRAVLGNQCTPEVMTFWRATIIAGYIAPFSRMARRSNPF